MICHSIALVLLRELNIVIALPSNMICFNPNSMQRIEAWSVAIVFASRAFGNKSLFALKIPICS